MFVDGYGALQESGHPDTKWLAKAYNDLEKDYEMWNREPHLAGDTGLSRYYDFGDGPPAEGAQDENGIYRQVATYFFFHPSDADHYLVETGAGGAEPVAGAADAQQGCDGARTMAPPEGDKPHQFKLSTDYYQG